MQTFDGVHGWAGWQWLFLLEALPASCSWAWSCSVRLDDNRSQARWLSDEESRFLTADLERDAGAQPAARFAMRCVDGRVWFGCLVYFCAVIGLYGISFWMPTIVSDMGVESRCISACSPPSLMQLQASAWSSWAAAPTATASAAGTSPFPPLSAL